MRRAVSRSTRGCTSASTTIVARRRRSSSVSISVCSSRSGLELDAFVEEIPLAETRSYVKRVLRSYNTYRMLYGGTSAEASTTAVGQTGSP